MYGHNPRNIRDICYSNYAILLAFWLPCGLNLINVLISSSKNKVLYVLFDLITVPYTEFSV